MNRISPKTRIAVLVVCALVVSASVLFVLRRRAEALPGRPTSTNISASASYGSPRRIASLRDPSIRESSGLVASRQTPGMFWTHNDSGDGPFIYAFEGNGRSRGVWRLNGVKARDWEAIAAGPGPDPNRRYLYIGDIGDNSGRRRDIVIYRVPEPIPVTGNELSTKRKPLFVESFETIRLRYPDGPHDAEALMVHPTTGIAYVVSKQVFGNPHVYETTAALTDGSSVTLRDLGALEIPSMFGGIITDGAISPDGTRVVLCDYLRGYEMVLKNANAAFNSIWKQPIATVDLGSRNQGEAITYRLDGRALLATSEGSPAPLLQIVRRNSERP